MQVIKLEGKIRTTKDVKKQQDLSLGNGASDADKVDSSLNGDTPMATGNQFLTAVMHRQIYPRLEPSHLGADTTDHTLPTEGTDGEEGEGLVTDEASSDFVTAQQTNSKLLQLLTGECSTQASATPTEGRDSGLYISPAKEGKGPSYEELDRPRSMPFKAHSSHPVTKKSPLATNVSRAPQLQQDHTHIAEKKAPTKTTTVRIKEETFPPEISTDPQPSAPPIDVLHAEIKKVNSYSGLGKRRSLFTQTPPPGKKPATPEHPVLAPEKSSPSPGQSLSSGALNLAAKMLSQATGGRLGMSSSSEIGSLLKSPPSQGEGAASQRKVQGPSSPSNSQGKPSRSRKPSSKQATPISGRRMSLDSTPTQVLSSPTHLVAGNASSGSSPPQSRAKSWLEHLKSKLPIHP